MDSGFDNRFKNRVKQVFENLDDGTADQGWLLLRAKYPEKKKDRPVIWFWVGAAAALLLLFLGTGIWLFDKTGPVEKFVVKHIVKTKTLTDNKLAIKHQPSTNKLGTVNCKNGSTAVVRTVDRPGVSSNKSKKGSSHLVAANSPSSPAGSVLRGLLKAKKATHTPPNRSKPVVDANDLAANDDEGLKFPVGLMDTVKKAGGADSKSVAAPKPAVKPSFLDKPNPVANSKQQTGSNKTGKNVVYSVYAGPFFNYAKGSNNQVNAGAGVASDIRLSNHIRLSTGLGVAQNNLSYSSQPAQPAIQKYITAVNLSVDKNNGGSAFSNAQPVPVATFKSYDAQLLALDLPVNVKYNFNPQKNDTYLSVGLSSGTFIDQNYTYQYSNNATVQQVGTTNSFGNFYFAKTLNVSFGVSYPMGKNQRIVIEPFLKYPFAGLGEQQIRFGAGGLNVKFNFKP